MLRQYNANAMKKKLECKARIGRRRESRRTMTEIWRGEGVESM
jgi:hypothetical protein